MCDCPDGYSDGDDGESCVKTVIVEEEELIPCESYDPEPAL